MATRSVDDCIATLATKCSLVTVCHEMQRGKHAILGRINFGTTIAVQAVESTLERAERKFLEAYQAARDARIIR